MCDVYVQEEQQLMSDDVAAVALRVALDAFDDWNGDIASLLLPEDSDTSASTSGSEDAVMTPPPSSRTAVGQAPHARKVTRKTPKKKGTLTRRKEEIERLRGAASVLTSELVTRTQRQAMWRDVGSTATSKERTQRPRWQEIAAHQFSARRTAEMENAHLRALLRREGELVQQLLQLREQSLQALQASTETTSLVQHGRGRDGAMDMAHAHGHNCWQHAGHQVTALEREQLRHLDVMEAQIDRVFTSDSFRAEARNFLHVDVTSDGYGGAVVVMKAAWVAACDVDTLAELIWNGHIKCTQVVHEDGHDDDHRTVFLEAGCRKSYQLSGKTSGIHGNAVFRRCRHHGEVLMLGTTTMRSTPAPADALFPGLVVRCEEWRRVLALRTASYSERSLHEESLSNVSQLQWYRRIHVTRVKHEAESEHVPVCHEARQFADQFAAHMAENVTHSKEMVEQRLQRVLQ